MASADKASKTMRIEITPYLPPGERQQPAIARQAKSLRHTGTFPPAVKRGVQALHKTSTKAVVKTRTQARALETRIFETFMRELRKGTHVS